MNIERRTFIGVPSHNGQIHGDLASCLVEGIVNKPLGSIAIRHQSMSLLARNFNDLFCQAINGGYTHFILIHADVIPMQGWFRKMQDIMDEKQCDILSVIIPKKNPGGQTSTAILTGENPFRGKCLTMKELKDMPETFERPDLLVNSGLMMVDLRAPWIGKVWFNIHDEVLKNPEGKYIPVGISEDWYFSLQARKQGAKIYATREVKVMHVGQHAFTNDVADWPL